MLDDIVNKALNIYRSNRLVNINLNVFGATVLAFGAAGLASGIAEYMQCSREAITGISLAADLCVYFPVQSMLHYFANKCQYLDGGGNVRWRSYWKDLLHVYATKLPVWAVTIPLCPTIQYYLMEHEGIGALASSQIAYWSMHVATRIGHSLLGWTTELFKTTKP